MYLKTHAIDHGQVNLNTALGLSRETQLLCRERILFNHFTNSLQAYELFEDVDDAPKELRTVTGDLQATLSTINDPLQYEYTLLTFFQFQKMATEIFGLYRAMTDPTLTEEQRLKAQLASIAGDLAIKKALEEKKEEEDEDDLPEIVEDMEGMAAQLTPSRLIRRIKLVKKAKYNFNRYLDLLNNRTPEADLNIDDMLKDIINGKD